jgi:predicted phosphatase
MKRKKRVDPIPEEFSSYEEAAEFWDTHDTEDYPEAFRDVDLKTKFRHRYYEVEIEPDVVVILKEKAKSKGVTIGHLVNDLLRQQLATSSS